MKLENDAKHIELIAKLLSNNIDSEEQATLMSWVEASDENRTYFNQMTQLWGITETFEEEEFVVDTQSAWTKVQPRITKKEEPKVAKVFSIRPLLRIAAAILVILTIGYWWVSTESLATVQEVVATTDGEQLEIILADGSSVWLNSNSQLSYNKQFVERVVTLEGEAFFDVVANPDKPFTIHTGEATTQVLGTSFNIRAYAEEEQVEVVVKTGRVELSSSAEETTTKTAPVELTPGNLGIFKKEERVVEKVEEKSYNGDSWKAKYLEFPDVPMRKVIPTLERYFDIQIKVSSEALFNCPLYLDRIKDPKREQLIEIIAFSLDVEIEIAANGEYTLIGEGCEK